MLFVYPAIISDKVDERYITGILKTLERYYLYQIGQAFQHGDLRLAIDKFNVGGSEQYGKLRLEQTLDDSKIVLQEFNHLATGINSESDFGVLFTLINNISSAASKYVRSTRNIKQSINNTDKRINSEGIRLDAIQVSIQDIERDMTKNQEAMNKVEDEYNAGRIDSRERKHQLDNLNYDRNDLQRSHDRLENEEQRIENDISHQEVLLKNYKDQLGTNPDITPLRHAIKEYQDTIEPRIDQLREIAGEYPNEIKKLAHQFEMTMKFLHDNDIFNDNYELAGYGTVFVIRDDRRELLSQYFFDTFLGISRKHEEDVRDDKRKKDMETTEEKRRAEEEAKKKEEEEKKYKQRELAKTTVAPMNSTEYNILPEQTVVNNVKVSVYSADGRVHEEERDITIAVKILPLKLSTNTNVYDVLIDDMYATKIQYTYRSLTRWFLKWFFSSPLYRIMKFAYEKLFYNPYGPNKNKIDIYKEMLLRHKGFIDASSFVQDVQAPSRDYYAAAILILSNFDLGEAEMNFFADPIKLRRLYSLGWNTFTILNDNQNTMLFCSYLENGMCSKIPYAYLFTGKAGEVFKTLDEVKTYTNKVFGRFKPIKFNQFFGSRNMKQFKRM